MSEVTEVVEARGDQVLLHLLHARKHVISAIRHHNDDQPDWRDQDIDEALVDIHWAKRSARLAQ